MAMLAGNCRQWIHLRALSEWLLRARRAHISIDRNAASCPKSGVTKTLADRIEQQLALGDWKNCAVYERELVRLWPLDQENREAKITLFAKEYGFRLRFYRKGMCAIFDKWPRAERL